MEYTVDKLARLANISPRTLRYYDSIGLLKPGKIRSNGYRIYGETELDRLQQILFFREMGMQLGEIGLVLDSKDFMVEEALQGHLQALLQRRGQLDRLIETVEKTIKMKKGEIAMSDKEKFEGFKQDLIDENEKKYGAEIREKYGEETVEQSNKKLKGMTREQYERSEALSEQIAKTLKAALEQGDPGAALAQEVCALHKEWLCLFWPKYSKEAHRNLAQMYVDDPRFTAYYDKIADGATIFLRDAIHIYCA